MEKGKIIFLNGVTSSGKTSIVEALQGKNVLIDGILVERDEIKPHYKQMLEIFNDNPLDIIEVYCPLDICKQRNIERENRYAEQSAEQHEIMSKGIKYRMRVDTSIHSPKECADIILKELFK